MAAAPDCLRDSSTLFAPLASHFVESAIVRIYWIVFITAGLSWGWWVPDDGKIVN